MNLLTVDVEDWARSSLPLLSHAQAVKARWYLEDQDMQVDRGVHRILAVLAMKDARATFFVLGKTAQAHPGLIRLIHRSGHEVASHALTHTPLPGMSAGALMYELSYSKKLLEDTIGAPVLGFRAPFLQVHPDLAAFYGALESAGYTYDSSRTSAKPRSTNPDSAYTPIQAGIVEFAITMRTILFWQVPLGGTYLRLLGPRTASRRIARENQAKRPAVVYIHPYEMDRRPVTWPHPNPTIAARISLMMRNLGKSRHDGLIANLLNRHRFTTIRQYMAGLQ